MKMATTMAADDHDNKVNGDGATGNEVDDIGSGMTGYNNDGMATSDKRRATTATTATMA